MEKKINYALLFLLMSTFLSCAKEVSQVGQKDQDSKAEQFLSNHNPDGKGRTYYIQNAIGTSPMPAINGDFASIHMQNKQVSDWETVHKKQRALIEKELSLAPEARSKDFLIGLELNIYIFMDTYLFKSPDGKAASEAASYYLRLLMEEVKNPAQWNTLARIFLLAQPRLGHATAVRYQKYIREAAGKVVQTGGEGIPELNQARQLQLESAQVALDLLASK